MALYPWPLHKIEMSPLSGYRPNGYFPLVIMTALTIMLTTEAKNFAVSFGNSRFSASTEKVDARGRVTPDYFMFTSTPEIVGVHPNEPATFEWRLRVPLDQLKPEGYDFSSLEFSYGITVPYQAIYTVRANSWLNMFRAKSIWHNDYEHRATVAVMADVVSFTLFGVTEVDTQASYSVEINFNGIRYINRHSRIVIFGPPMQPQIEPSSGETEANVVLVLTCSSGSTSTPRSLVSMLYTWTRNNQALPDERHRTSGDQNDILTIDPVTREDHEAVYECTVQEEGSSYSNKEWIRLDVRYRPASATSVSSVVGPHDEGHSSDVVLKCQVDDPGNPTAVFDWSKDGQIRATGAGSTFTILSGQLSRSKHGGLWTCTPRNEFGSGTPGTMILRVLGPPMQPEIEPSSGETKENGVFVLTCSSRSTSTPRSLVPMLYTWKRNNRPLPGNRHRTSGAQNNILTIDPVTREDHEAVYECMVQEEGSLFSNKERRQLNVRYQPASATSVSSVVGPHDEGHPSDVVLECQVDNPGNPTAVFDWSKDGQIRATGAGSTFTILSGQLSLSEHGGLWTCTPRNEIGSGSPGTITVNVNERKTIFGLVVAILSGSAAAAIGVLIWEYIEIRPRRQEPVKEKTPTNLPVPPLCFYDKEKVNLESLVHQGVMFNIWNASAHKNTISLPRYFVAKSATLDSNQGKSASDDFLESQGQMLNRLMRQDCVLSCLGRCSGMLLLEIAPYGDLHRYLVAMADNTDANNDLSNSRTSLVSFVHQVLEALSVVDSLMPDILHYSLSTKDVLLFNQHKIKIGNFATMDEVRAREQFEEENKLPRPYRWMAPETVTLKHGKKSDVYSLGVLIWEILNYGDQPLEDIKDEHVPASVRKGCHPLITDLITPEQYQVLESCWRFSPSDRPDIDSVKTQMEKVIARESKSLNNVHSNISLDKKYN